mmetsp:Transcript_11241/g.25520  ORF Transcript_11241/g.25520 Transcript_11241/m.25520 type:complete len:118 (+) Transcript_11241:1943-2296(+)
MVLSATTVSGPVDSPYGRLRTADGDGNNNSRRRQATSAINYNEWSGLDWIGLDSPRTEPNRHEPRNCAAIANSNAAKEPACFCCTVHRARAKPIASLALALAHAHTQNNPCPTKAIL